MSRVSKVYSLPKELQDELNKRLRESGFSNYRGLEAWLKEEGYSINIGSLHKYAKRYQDKVEHAKESVEIAKYIIESSPDEKNALNESLIVLCQATLLDFLVLFRRIKTEEDLDTMQTLIDRLDRIIPLMNKLTRSIADLSSASQSVKKYAADIEAKTLQVAAEISSKAKAKGLSDKTAEEIRAKILGISQ